MGFMWFSFGLMNSTGVLKNGPRRCCMGVLVDWVMCFGLWASRVSPSNLLGAVWDILLDLAHWVDLLNSQLSPSTLLDIVWYI
jgi:hypothetical protein